MPEIPLSIGVPVNPISVAFGSALDMRAPRMPYWVRWASSTMTMTFSEGFRTSSSPSGRVEGVFKLLDGGHYGATCPDS